MCASLQPVDVSIRILYANYQSIQDKIVNSKRKPREIGEMKLNFHVVSNRK